MADTEQNGPAAADEMQRELDAIKDIMKVLAQQAADATNTVKVLKEQAEVSKQEERKTKITSALGIIKTAAGRRLGRDGQLKRWLVSQMTKQVLIPDPSCSGQDGWGGRGQQSIQNISKQLESTEKCNTVTVK